ncbi:MAG: META domain-containing protein [Lysobacteraceae bacterium]
MSASRLLIVAAMLLLSACEAPTEGTNSAASMVMPPNGSKWQLVSGLPDKLPAEVTISLQFGVDGSISGTGGCNLYRSHMSIEGGSVTVSPIVASKRGCLGPAGQLESQFFTAMSKVSGLSSDAANLRLALSDGGELLFEVDGDSSGK